MSKVLLWIGGGFFLFGLVFGGIGGAYFLSTQQVAGIGTHASGTVIGLASSYNSDSGTTHRPVVEFYDARGTRHEFTGSVGSSPAAYSRGEQVDVIYDPAAPGQAIVDSFTERYLFPLVFGGFGTLFGLIGAGILFAFLRRRRIVARLIESGVPIGAEFLECYRDTSTKVNGRSPWRVVGQATHPATGKLQSFRSDEIWVDLTDQLQNRDIKVLIDPAKPKQYYVDLSEFIDKDGGG